MPLYHIPTKVLFGSGAIHSLHEQELPFKKALIVTTNGKSVIQYGYLDMVRDELKKAGIASIVFDKVQGNPTHAAVLEGASLAKENRCDVIVGLGGGSPIDTDRLGKEKELCQSALEDHRRQYHFRHGNGD